MLQGVEKHTLNDYIDSVRERRHDMLVSEGGGVSEELRRR